MKRDPIDVTELIEALKIPEFEKAIYMKFQGLKSGEHGRLLTAFDEKKKSLKQRLFKSRQEKQGNDGNGIDPDVLYWFELLQYKPGDWRTTALEPVPPPYFDHSEILPPDVIDYIDDAPVQPHDVVKLTGILSDEFNKAYDLDFVRYSENSAMGVIWETTESIKNHLKLKEFSGNETTENLYRLMFYYMKRYPDIRDQLVRELFQVILPFKGIPNPEK